MLVIQQLQQIGWVFQILNFIREKNNLSLHMVNLVIGFPLFRAGHLAVGKTLSLPVFFAGIAVIGIFSSKHFSHKRQA
jgi:hypothetical protein